VTPDYLKAWEEHEMTIFKKSASLDWIVARVDASKLRNVPGWTNAPVPICMGGDPRALTFCCKPGYALVNETHCMRDQMLRKIGMTHETFIAVKEQFSEEMQWADPAPCFSSLSYCCMRAGGCVRRDAALLRRYADLADEGAADGKPSKVIMKEYFTAKKELAKRILSAADNSDFIEPWIEFGD
jgi:predicted metal-binding transcription factor (methanogenesis marker protein 9)